jgi:Cu/Ag efflux protein CusF
MNAMSLSAALVISMSSAALGFQVTKTIPGESKVVTVTVEAIERGSRELTVKKTDGTYEQVYVPAEIKRFDTLKVGDRITARYYETVVLRLKAPGEKDADTSKSSVVPTETGTAGTAAHQQVITATITAIDPNVPSITFSGPRGWTYSSRVEDKQALAAVKVGDKVEITWTEAVILSLDDVK